MYVIPLGASGVGMWFYIVEPTVGEIATLMLRFAAGPLFLPIVSQRRPLYLAAGPTVGGIALVTWMSIVLFTGLRHVPPLIHFIMGSLWISAGILCFLASVGK